MARDLHKQVLINTVITAGLAAISLFIGRSASDLITNIAVNLGSGWTQSLIDRLVQHGSERWFSQGGMFNHDIAKALAQALQAAVGTLRLTWQEQESYKRLMYYDPQSAQLTLEALRALEENGGRFFLEAEEAHLYQEYHLKPLLQGDETKIQAYLVQKIADWLLGHDPDFVTFIQKRLFEIWFFQFGEILKDPGEAGTRAWRACQRLWRETLSTTLIEVQDDLVRLNQSSQEIQRDLQRVLAWLQQWAERLERLPATQRDNTGLEALEAVLSPVREQLQLLMLDTAAIRKDATEIKREVKATQQHTLEIKQMVEEWLEIQIPAPPEHIGPPIITNFVGRKRELTRYLKKLQTAGFVVIAGMAGVGKTALAAQLAQEAGEPEKIFWHTFHQGEEIQSIIGRIAGFLARHQQPELWRMFHIRTDNTLPPEVWFDYVLRLIRQQNYLLCLDDFHHVDQDPLLETLVKQLMPLIQTGEVRAIITSRRIPNFIRTTDHEPLTGLNLTDTRRFLTSRKIRLKKEQMEGLYESTKGNTQLLTLAAAALSQLKDQEKLLTNLINLVEVSDIEEYLLNEVDQSLEPEERQVMNGVAVLLDYPGTRRAIEAVLGNVNARRQLIDLTHRYLLQEYSSEGDRVYGQHPIVQAFYYTMPMEHERREMHSRAGAYYEQTEPNALRAAIHFDRASQHDHAVQLATQNLWPILNQGHAQELATMLHRVQARQLEPHLWAEVNLALGQIYTLQGKGEQARKHYQIALDQIDALSGSVETHTLAARACRGMGESLELESPQEALTWLQRGLAKCPQDNWQERAALSIAIGTAQMYLSNYSEAQAALEQGLALLPRQPTQLQASALLNLAGILFYLGDLKQAKAYGEQALYLSEQLHDPFRTAETLGNLGMVKYVSGDWKEGIQDFERALTLAKEWGYEKFKATIELQLGIAYINLGDSKAEQYLNNVLEWAYVHHDLTTETFAQLRLADLYIRLDEHLKAKQFLSKAENLALELKDPGFLSTIYHLLAEIELAGDKKQEALAHIQQALKINEDLGETLGKGMSLRVLGQVFFAQDEQTEAFAAFRESLTTLNGRDPYEVARTKVEWGKALLVVGDSEQGTTLLQEAKATFERLGALHDLVKYHKVMESSHA